jgi:hypothetical protein
LIVVQQVKKFSARKELEDFSPYSEMLVNWRALSHVNLVLYPEIISSIVYADISGHAVV